MIQKYSDLRVLEVFFKEPMTMHFIRELSRKINLSAPSVKIIVDRLIQSGLIKLRKSKPFDGYVANRENDSFFFYKKAFNLWSLEKVKDSIVNSLHPKAIVLFGSYSRGEDIESSDIDILIISNVKKELKLSSIEKELKRSVNIMIVKDLKELDQLIVNKIHNGIVIYGEI